MNERKIRKREIKEKINNEEAVSTQTSLQPVTTCVCKPEAANTVRAPDDERYAARNMLSLQ